MNVFFKHSLTIQSYKTNEITYNSMNNASIIP